MRLTCFPYAGGGSQTFRTLPSLLPALDVSAAVLPGRGRRISEPAHRSMDGLVDMLLDELSDRFLPPFALLGHSMGAAIAFELASRLRDLGRPGPDHLFLSARPAPGEPPRRQPLHLLDDARLKDELYRLGGTADEILRDEQLMMLILPTLRADLTLSERHRPRPERALASSITGLVGRDDEDVPFLAMLPWRQMTRGRFKLCMLPGNHFFIETALSAVAAIIEETIAATDVSGSQRATTSPSLSLLAKGR